MTLLIRPLAGGSDSFRCKSNTVTARDLADLHAVYHPGVVPRQVLESMVVVPVSSFGAEGRWWGVRWDTPPTTLTQLLNYLPGDYNAWFNSPWVGLFRRVLLDQSRFINGVGGWELVEVAEPAENVMALPLEENPAGREYMVMGLTRGDHMRSPSLTFTASAHETVPGGSLLPGGSFPEQGWTLGDRPLKTVRLSAPAGEHGGSCQSCKVCELRSYRPWGVAVRVLVVEVVTFECNARGSCEPFPGRRCGELRSSVHVFR